MIGAKDSALRRARYMTFSSVWIRRSARVALAGLGLFVLLTLVPVVGAGGSGNHFYAGYCTWEAAELGYQAWGVWVPWLGDAGDWSAGAVSAGWSVSSTPQPNSIAAMPRGVQGSGAYGHVGWVSAVDSDGGGVTLVSMNWRGRGVVTEHRIVVDGLVMFITPPAESA